MVCVRCLVCRVEFSTLRMLRSHCFSSHSKRQLVRTLLKSAIFIARKDTKRLQKAPKEVSFVGVSPKYIKSEILYLEDDFEESETEKILETDALDFNENVKLADDEKEVLEKSCSEAEGSTEPSDLENKSQLRYLILHFENEANRRKQRLDLMRKFRFERTYDRQYPNKSLNETTGRFYICTCSEMQKNNNLINVYQKSDLQNLKSDTESCSDNNGNCIYRPTVQCKFFCNTCGNGYRTKFKLIQHLKTHETKCKICDKIFSSPRIYKEHMRKHLLKVFVCHVCKREFSHKIMLLDHLDAHIEDEVYDNVFGLEQDYRIDNQQFYHPVFHYFR